MADMKATGKVFAAIEYKAKPGMRGELIKGIKEGKIDERFRKQPGCLYFEYSEKMNDPDVLCLTDIWETVQDFTNHLSCDVIPDFVKLKEQFVADQSAQIYKDE